MFEPPVTLIESKKQKTAFDDVDGKKVIAYLEKDSPGTVRIEIFEGRGEVSFRILDASVEAMMLYVASNPS